jgi:DNA topoisomerase-1
MPKPLVIVESPAKARTVAGFLGKNYTVESSIGHIRDLPRKANEIPKSLKGEPWARLGVNVEKNFEPIYIIPIEKREQVKKLKALLKGASELYLATDEDREGEAIAWHLLQALAPKIPVRRMVFHEITRKAILEALEKWRELDRGLVDAQEARRVLDRLYGWEVSEVLWKKVMRGLSAGRVQSVATRLVVEREKLRIAFRAAEYWDLEGHFEADTGAFKATLSSVDGKRVATGKDFDPNTGALKQGSSAVPLDGDAARALVDALEGAAFEVAAVEAKSFNQQPQAPFITSTLQQEAGRKLRFTASRTMRAAQRLYEAGFITYMRTDSVTLSEQALDAARKLIRSMYGAEYLPAEPRKYHKKVKNAQEAHEAIRPAGEAFKSPDDVKKELDDDEARLYELIWKRTMASQMADSRGRQVSARIAAEGKSGQSVLFAASGRTIEFPGFLRAYVQGADDPDAELEDRETFLPPLEQGQTLACSELASMGHATQPPARFTEASLVKELEARGIGRPSTYASVIQTIQNRGYVWKKGSALVPAWTAFAVVKLMTKHFGALIDFEFTARMEEDLDAIARGERESVPYLRAFYFGNGDKEGLHKLVRERLPEIEARPMNTIPIGTDAEGRDIAVRVGRYGPYVQRGDQTAAVPEDLPPDALTVDVATELLAKLNALDRVIGAEPESGLPVYAKDGRYGPYVQLGDPEPQEGKKKSKKPKTASLFPDMKPDTISMDDALRLLSLPRLVGEAPPATGGDALEIQVYNGRYGPYLRQGEESRSLASHDQIFTVTLEEAVALFAQPKKGRGRGTPNVLKALGVHPQTGDALSVLEGRYGPYVTDGKINASLPRGKDPQTLSVEEAVDLIRAREEKGVISKPVRKKVTRKKVTRKKVTRKKVSQGKVTPNAPVVKKANKRPPARKNPATKKAPAQKRK